MGPPDSSPHLAGVHLTHRAGSTAIQQVGQIPDFPPATEDKGYGSGRRQVGCAGEHFDSTVSREHMHCSRALASHPDFPFSIYCFQDLASGSGTRHHCSQISTSALDHRPSLPTRLRGQCPGEPAALVLDVLHVYACVPRSLPVPCPPPSVNVSR